MNVPEEFKRACGNLHQDIDLLAKTPDDLALIAINSLTDYEKKIVKIFLEKTIRDVNSEVSLKNIWRAAGSDIFFPNPDDILLVMRLMLKQLN